MRRRYALVSACLSLAACAPPEEEILRGPGGGNDNGPAVGRISNPNDNADLPDFETFNVDIADFAFEPREITVSAGDSVIWTNRDSVFHTVTSGTPNNPARLFDSGTLRQGETFEFTFLWPGDVPYFCRFHPLPNVPDEQDARVTVDAPLSSP